MNSGRELDALIAEKVMGLKEVRFQEQGYHNDLVHGPNRMAGVAVLVPFYSTDISAAWGVVEKIIDDWEKRNFQITVAVFYDGICSNGWICRIFIEKKDVILSHDDPMDGSDTAPHAICLAALKAIGHEFP